MHLLIVRNNANPQAVDASLLLATYLATQGLTYDLLDVTDLAGGCDNPSLASLVREDTTLAVALGGDGTILRTARLVGSTGVPVLGLNFGRLGFLANSSEGGIIEVVTNALAGDVVAEQRTNLHITVVCEGEADPWEDDGVVADFDPFEPGDTDSPGLTEVTSCEEGVKAGSRREFFALNEIAVTRGANGRVIDFAFGVSGERVAHMRGDGLVVASATGSTAYALSAGGPLVAPGFNGLVVVPIAPHTLYSRALVTSASDVVEVDLEQQTARRDATLFVDGDLLLFDKPIKRVYVSRGSVPTTLLRHCHEGFYTHASKVFFSQ